MSEWGATFPPDGAWRVHPDPELLPRAPKFEEGEVAQSRFDDPAGQYKVRYAATTLRGCLLEVVSASFRTRRPVEERLAAVTNAETFPGDLADLGGAKDVEPPGRIPPEWLAVQKVGRFRVDPESVFTDVMRAGFLVRYDEHPRIRRAIERHLGEQYDLDAGTIMLNLHHGRPVTQAVSAVVWGEEPPVAGIRYLSRLDLAEECWAVFDRTPVDFDVPTALDPDDATHREALRDAAELLRLALPDAWRD